jgi:hypothetical protein
MERSDTQTLVRTLSTASHFASGKDAFHCVPKITQPKEWDAVESVLTNESDAVERILTI